MIRFVARRIGSGVVLLLAITSLAYLLLYAGAGDISRRILGQSATPEAVAAKDAELGLDRPIPEQFVTWIVNALGGDLGYSWFTGQTVDDAIAARLPVTLSLVFGAVLLSAVVSVILGTFAATKGGIFDRITQIISLLGFAIPGFLVAVALVVVFALTLGWFTPTGFVPFLTSPAGWVSTVTLPIIALALGGIASVTQQIRGSMIDALRNDYVRTLRSRGLSERRVVYKHVLRNAAAPALAVLALQFVGLLGGAVIVEQVFAIPGVGPAAVSATNQGDVPLVMGLITATAVIVIVFNLIIELLQGWLNPKARIS